MKIKILIAPLVRKIMKDVNYNELAATAKLLHQISSNTDIKAAFINYGIKQAIRNFFTDERRLKGFEETYSKTITLSAIDLAKRQEEKIERRAFWDRYTLYGHGNLRKACKPELIFSAQNRRTQAAGNIVRANFEEAIADKMTSNTVSVERQLNIKTILELAGKHNVIHQN